MMGVSPSNSIHCCPAGMAVIGDFVAGTIAKDTANLRAALADRKSAFAQCRMLSGVVCAESNFARINRTGGTTGL